MNILSSASPVVVVDLIMLALALIGALVASFTITIGRVATCTSMAQTYPSGQPNK